jgi:arginine:ornithine antiporter / lysine permease
MDQPISLTTPASVPGSGATDQPESRKLGVILLTGVVVGSMIGGGSFNLPANMAGGAGLVAIAIAWVVTFIGMYFLSNSFRILSDKRPDLKGGIYSYAAAGFGPFAGFQMAWGYWLSSAFGNVAFAVLIMQILSYFFPVFGNGQNWPSIIGGSILIWVMFSVVLSGVKRTAALSVLASILNITTISFALIVMAFFMTGGKFTFDIWGQHNHLGSIFTQVKSTMLVTLALVQIPLFGMFEAGSAVDFVRVFRYHPHTKTNFAPEPSLIVRPGATQLTKMPALPTSRAMEALVGLPGPPCLG